MANAVVWPAIARAFSGPTAIPKSHSVIGRAVARTIPSALLDYRIEMHRMAIRNHTCFRWRAVGIIVSEGRREVVCVPGHALRVGAIRPRLRVGCDAKVCRWLTACQQHVRARVVRCLLVCDVPMIPSSSSSPSLCYLRVVSGALLMD